ncbi:YceI family protein [Novosphingobium sp. SL115]|uniref:YceI family protein n=1 Tax=Novosphingobium sp. SL115 TaxID=2995150 RepID=UPI0022734B83|nr:YceI family protein [Novosphingobium sp. SL115]MCY1671505.1 YceI family protein [Novosphingobium sp. SL115]
MLKLPKLSTALKVALPLALAAAAAPMVAQMPEVPGKADKARVVAGTYTADAGHSLVAWKVNHFGFNDYFGLFGDVSGTLEIDPANPAAAKVSVKIPVSKVVTASAGLTGHLLKPAAEGKPADFFGAAPADATFVSTSVAPGADGTSAKITGNLTLNGVTKPVTVDATFAGAGTNPFSKAATLGFHGKAAIKRSDFNIKYGLPFVSDDVMLDITAAFEKK